MKAKNETVDRWLDSHRDEITADLQSLLRIRSVYEGESEAEEGKPFGPAIYDCLKAALGIAQKLGFEGEDLDGYCGCVSAGEGEETLGILAHLDVVPESTGWTYPPYGAQIADGKLYGRGAIDDKGPAVAALWALKAVTECGLKLRKKVNVILGCDEETDMRCLEHFKKNRPIPDFSISPDGEFPLTNSEKTISVSVWTRSFASRLKISAGTVHNAVPGEAEGFVPLPASVCRAAAERIAASASCTAEVSEEAGGTRIKVTGRTAHASMPQDGRNALQALLLIFAELPIEGEDGEAVRSLARLLRMDCFGEMFGLDREDASGRLTFNVSIMDWNEEGYRLTFDLRVPISIGKEELQAALEGGMSSAGASLEKMRFSQGYCIPDDSEFVQKLIKVFNDRTGENMKPRHIGGGTYARYLPNAVSFGPENYMCEAHAHVADEFISLEQLMFNCKILADAIIALACE